MTNTTNTPAMADLDKQKEINRIVEYWEDQARRGCVDALQCALKEAWDTALARRAAQPVAPVQAPNGWTVERVGDALHIKRADGKWTGFMVENGPRDALTFEFLSALATPSPQVAEGAELPPLPAPGKPAWDSEFGYTAADMRAYAIAASRGEAEKSRRAAGGEVECTECEGLGTYEWQGGDNDCAYCDGTGRRAAPASAGQAAPASLIGYVAQEQLDWLARSTSETACVSLWRAKAPINAVPVYLAAQPAEGAGQAGEVAMPPCKYEVWPKGLSPRTCLRCGKGPCSKVVAIGSEEFTERAAAPADSEDAARLDYLDALVHQNKSAGNHWFTFSFTDDKSARVQIDAERHLRPIDATQQPSAQENGNAQA